MKTWEQTTYTVAVKIAERANVTKAQKLALDRLCRDVVMSRAGAFRIEDTSSWVGPCERCGKRKPLQWAHGVSRRYLALRWSLEPRNSFALCAGCHLWGHHQPTEWAAWLESKIGAEEYQKLRIILKTKRRPDYAAIRLSLEAAALKPRA